jgi:hypothetical protein
MRQKILDWLAKSQAKITSKTFDAMAIIIENCCEGLINESKTEKTGFYALFTKRPSLNNKKRIFD